MCRSPACSPAMTGRCGVHGWCACANNARSRTGADARRVLRSERRGPTPTGADAKSRAPLRARGRRSPAPTRHTPAPTHAARSPQSALPVHVNADAAPGPVPVAVIGDETGDDTLDDTGAGADEQHQRRRKATRSATSARPVITRAETGASERSGGAMASAVVASAAPAAGTTARPRSQRLRGF